MTSQERFSTVHAQLEHLQAKHVGTGHADTTKLCAMHFFLAHALCEGTAPCKRHPLTLLCARECSEWAVNQHRDSLALYVGFDSLSHYIAVAENESVGRVKFNAMQKMIQPCGPPPPKEDE